MFKKWFQCNEVAAGTKRLILTFYLYKIFGEFIVRIIAFFIALSVFLTSKEKRTYAEIYLGKIYQKPPLFSTFRLFLNYADSLIDKMISFSGNLNPEKFNFMEDSEELILKHLNNNEGMFFLTTHIGNAEILRSLLCGNKTKKPPFVNVFLEKKVCKIFNDFLDSIKVEINLETIDLDDIGVDTAIILSDKLKNGELVFMAGDRLSENNSEKFYTADFLNDKIKLPIGSIKLAQILNAPIFFIVCAKEKGKFNVHIEKFSPKSTTKKEITEELKLKYTKFLEKYTKKYPLQFFHFYNIFEVNSLES